MNWQMNATASISQLIWLFMRSAHCYPFQHPHYIVCFQMFSEGNSCCCNLSSNHKCCFNGIIFQHLSSSFFVILASLHRYENCKQFYMVKPFPRASSIQNVPIKLIATAFGLFYDFQGVDLCLFPENSDSKSYIQIHSFLPTFFVLQER